jgi:RsiW-degrading membrane proteinase PrsW (M82 family)
MLLYILILGFVAAAIGLAWFLIAHDHGEKEPIGALWLAAGCGLVASVLAGAIEQAILPKDVLLPGTAHGTLLIATLAIGFIEEICKFGPFALFIYRKRYFNEHTDGIIYFAIAGLGFGLPENILYTVQYGAQAGTGRTVLTPFFHAAITGLIGYFLARNKLAGKRVAWIGLPLLTAMLLHGLYDYGLASGSAILAAVSITITLSASAGLFYAYVRATELDQDEGRSIVGRNAFCRSCGAPNPAHHLYCVSCGKNA